MNRIIGFIHFLIPLFLSCLSPLARTSRTILSKSKEGISTCLTPDQGDYGSTQPPAPQGVGSSRLFEDPMFYVK